MLLGRRRRLVERCTQRRQETDRLDVVVRKLIGTRLDDLTILIESGTDRINESRVGIRLAEKPDDDAGMNHPSVSCSTQHVLLEVATV